MKKRILVQSIILSCVFLVGMFIVTANVVFFGIQLRGSKLGCVGNWFEQNTAPSMSWSRYLPGAEDRFPILFKYSEKKNNIDKYIGFVEAVEDDITNFCTTGFPICKETKDIVDYYRKNVLSISCDGEIDGKTDYIYAKEAADKILQFSEWCNEKNIHFVYVNCPSGDRLNKCSQYGSGNYDASMIARGDYLGEILEESNIHFINIVKNEKIMDEVKVGNTDHWTSSDALKTTVEIGEYINQFISNKSNSRIDLEGKNYKDILPNEIKLDSKRELGFVDDLLLPIDSDYYMLQQEDGFNEWNKEGSFSDIAFREKDFWGLANRKDYFGVWDIENGYVTRIENMNVDYDERILILGDSFALPDVFYLSSECHNISMLHPGSFWGDVKKYIEYYKPQIIIWTYTEGQIGKKNDWAFGWVSK